MIWHLTKLQSEPKFLPFPQHFYLLSLNTELLSLLCSSAEALPMATSADKGH